MPIPKPTGSDEREYISKCISAIADEYTEEGQPYAVCKSTWDNRMSAQFEGIDFATLPTTDCIEMHKSAGYNNEDAKQACSKYKGVSEDAQQGGVVGFARTKFEYPPLNKEKMQDYMARCMADTVVRDRKPNRSERARFCFTEYQNRYIASIGKRWK